METRPELILLQKSMVIVEGVARSLDPGLNIWTAAEPIAKDWVESNYGVAGRLRDAGEGAETMGRVFADLPRLLEQAERSAHAFSGMAREGVRLDDDTVRRIATENHRQSRLDRWAIWAGVVALAVLAWVAATG